MDYREMQNANTYATGAVAKAVDPTESASPIRDGISISEQTLSELHSVIEQLEQRLGTVLTPTPPTTTNANKQSIPTPSTSHVHGRLMILNEGFSIACVRLRDIMRRVEI